MKKLFALAASLVLGSALVFAGCGSDKTANAGGSDKKEVTLTVGASPTPHAEILEQVKPILAKKGINLKIVEFTDYVKPNIALNDKELDANFFQHVPYMEKFAKEHNENLVAVAKVHVEPMGVYSKTIKDKDLKNAVPDGAKVAVPNDPTNEGRALLLLQKAGLITLKDPKNLSSTPADITSNPKHLQFVELDAAQLPLSLDAVALAVINTNYSLDAKLNPFKDALVIEDKNSPYANVLTVRAGDENRPEIKELAAALNSPEIKKFIEDKYQGAIVPAF